jgi:NADPH:quinone reductase-like Zn-dependent oxidoreductase
MKAIAHDTYGTTDDLSLRELDVPAIGDDEVLLRVHAAGVNPLDAFLLTGTPYLIRLVFGLRGPKQKTRGADVAGTVAAVGANVTRFAPGDEVFGEAAGSFAEYARAKPDQLAPKPTRLTFAQAAAVPIAAVTALRALRDHAKLQPGQHLLVNGAAGGIGTFAVQLAKAYGAEVTGVCGPHNVELVRSIGADHVVDYTAEDFTAAAGRYDAILDNVGNRPLSALRWALTPTGTLIPNSGKGDGKVIGPMGRTLRAHVTDLFVGQRTRTFVARVNHADLIALAELIDAGKVTPVVGRTYPLTETAAAIDEVTTGHARGKLVIEVTQRSG